MFAAVLVSLFLCLFLSKFKKLYWQDKKGLSLFLCFVLLFFLNQAVLGLMSVPTNFRLSPHELVRYGKECVHNKRN